MVPPAMQASREMIAAKDVLVPSEKNIIDASTVSNLFMTPTTVKLVALTRFRKPKPVKEIPSPTTHDAPIAVAAYGAVCKV